MAAQDFSGRTMADAETNIGSCGLASVLSTSNPCPSMPTVMLVPSALGVTGDAGGTPRRIAAGQIRKQNPREALSMGSGLAIARQCACAAFNSTARQLLNPMGLRSSSISLKKP